MLLEKGEEWGEKGRGRERGASMGVEERGGGGGGVDRKLAWGEGGKHYTCSFYM